MATPPSQNTKAVYTLLSFLQRSLHEDETISEENKESLEVAFDCLQQVFGMNMEDTTVTSPYQALPTLEELIDNSLSDEEKHAEAERLKNLGNTRLMDADHHGAIELYTQAIRLSPSTPPYYANRAAAYMKINEFEKALTDCQKAIELKPDYAKAYGRMGLICTKLSQPAEARTAFEKALELDPDNVEYKSALESLGAAPQPQGGPAGGVPPQMPPFNMAGLGNLMSNPGFMDLASTVMANPMFQNMATTFFQQQGGGAGGGAQGPMGMNIAGMMPQLAEMGRQMQETDPNMFEQLRNRAAQFQATHADQPPPKEDEKKDE